MGGAIGLAAGEDQKGYREGDRLSQPAPRPNFRSLDTRNRLLVNPIEHASWSCSCRGLLFAFWRGRLDGLKAATHHGGARKIKNERS